MCEISDMICLLILIYLSFWDLRKHMVPIAVIVVAGMAAVLCQIISGSVEIVSFMGGAALGLFFLLMSKVTEEGIGYGDSLGILILGIYLGFWKIVSVLLCTFFLLFCVLVPMLWRKKMSPKAGLAFYPFLTAGYFWVLMMGG